MKTVGIRNLKNSLSRYIEFVKDGERILITDHDRIVAELTPPGNDAEAKGLLDEYITVQASGKLIIRATEKMNLKTKKTGAKVDASLLDKIYEESRSERL